MSPNRKALVFGGGGTLAYHAIFLVIGWAADRFQSNGAFTMMEIVAFPLIPSMMPGFIVSLLLAALGVRVLMELMIACSLSGQLSRLPW